MAVSGSTWRSMDVRQAAVRPAHVLPRAAFAMPPANTPLVVIALAVSLFTFAYSVQFGKVFILALYAVWLLPLVMLPRLALMRPAATVPALMLAGYAVLSTLWSDNPSASLRAGIQYSSTIVVALIAARVMGARAFLMGGVLGSIVVIVYSFAVGRYAYDVIDASYAFVGAFQSKNQLGFFASLALIFGLATAVVDRNVLLRALGVVVAAVGAWLMAKSDSATSIITCADALCLMVALLVGRFLRPTPRLVVFCAGGAFALAVTVLALEAGGFGSLLSVFGRDGTLTGRTYLWAAGLDAAGQNLMFGMGYNAFWTVGFLEAERLWEVFYITGKTGFHFHNTYIEAAVGLGLVGLTLLMATLAVVLGRGLRAILRPSMSVDTVVCVTLVALLLVRSAVEIDFLQPYTVGTFLLFFALDRLAVPVDDGQGAV